MSLSEIPLKDIPTKALVVDKAGAPFVLQDVVLDEVRADEVLVEMHYTGLCHTDLVLQSGEVPFWKYPAIFGHEGAGTIRRIGSSVQDKSLKGQLGTCKNFTAVNFLGGRVSDGSSPAALANGGGSIRAQFFGQSSFSKLSVVSGDCVLKCDVSDADLALMAPLGCGYLTGAGTVFNILKPDNTSTIAILGMGGVGLAALMAAKALSAHRIIAVDMVDSKLELALTLGATDVINTVQQPNIYDSIKGLLELGVDHILDTTGVIKLIEMGIKSLSHGGTMALVGVPQPGVPLQLEPMDLLASCKKLVGVIEGAANPAQVIPRLIQLYHEGKFPLDKLGRIYQVASIDKAIADMKSGAIIKPIISWEGI